MSLTHSSLSRAGRWFLESGIQDDSGGVARYYRSDVGRNAGVSTEITGYAVSALVYLYRAPAAASTWTPPRAPPISWSTRLGTAP